MAKTNMTEEQFREHWEGMPQSDRAFISTMLALTDLIGDDQLRFCEITRKAARALEGTDRDTLFTIMTLCVGILTDAPALERVARKHPETGALARKKVGPHLAIRKNRKPKEK